MSAEHGAEVHYVGDADPGRAIPFCSACGALGAAMVDDDAVSVAMGHVDLVALIDEEEAIEAAVREHGVPMGPIYYGPAFR